jgi:hypothetical protein
MRSAATIPSKFTWFPVKVSQEVEPEIDTTLDNDPATLEKDRNTFQSMLARLSPRVRIDHIEKDNLGRDIFVLTTSSLNFIESIKTFFIDKTLQYQVQADYFNTAVEGKESNGLKPKQLTVAIARMPLKVPSRYLPGTILATGCCICVLITLLTFLYRILFL